MTEKELNETKEKIITSARILFADHGFEGTSIRDIAKAADVNVASVNYHFSNKENLFTEILHAGYVECSVSMRTMYSQGQPPLEDVLVYLFRYFQNKSHDLITFFKMMMSTQHNHHMASGGTEDEFFGPPGGKVIAEAITKEVGGVVKDEDLHWALRSLFSHVIHTSIMYNCCFKQNQDLPFTSDADIVTGIRRLARVVIRDLKNP
jgi:AcrR family transcriptional regulator